MDFFAAKAIRNQSHNAMISYQMLIIINIEMLWFSFHKKLMIIKTTIGFMLL